MSPLMQARAMNPQLFRNMSAYFTVPLTAAGEIMIHPPSYSWKDISARSVRVTSGAYLQHYRMLQISPSDADCSDMNEHPKKRKRKTSFPSRYAGQSSAVASAPDVALPVKKVENNGIYFDHCYSVCSLIQADPKLPDSEGA
ncbi:unnamed protein product [Ranitomeya imitator]|uniref:Uncharacterized protein n=1 Tax=Ranitomeya imitator TaxID=111125 RepID=A0ABN9M5T2_9NEOB|nr:unnamed protein product [Ranitomeya imitator]